MKKCLVLFSGGLDSAIAVHLLKQLNVEVLAVHFVLPFYSGLGIDHAIIKERTRMLGVPLRIEEEGEEYLLMFKDPAFGYGKNINPCLDCRMHRLAKAKTIMEAEDASFIATGEVVGQRPMSQRRDCLDILEKKTGLRGLLLRPLSARLLRPTIPEEKGWVDRNKLLSIGGRGRKEQIAYAKQYGLTYSTPGGGCLLTHVQTARRFADLIQYSPDFALSDFKLIAYGRHFRLGQDLRLIVARDDKENDVLEKLLLPGDCRLQMTDIPGPLGILRGRASPADLDISCMILTRYSKARMQTEVRVTISGHGLNSIISTRPAIEKQCDDRRI